MGKETPMQFSARRLRIAIESAKIAVMAVQEELSEFRGKTGEYQQLTDAALRKLDAAWMRAVEREKICKKGRD